MAHITGKKKKWFLRWWFVLPAVVVLAGAGVYAYNQANKPKYVLITAERGTVSQEVSVTGQVASAEDLQLAFEGTGKVAKVYHGVGDRVAAGDPIVSLISSDLSAQLDSAVANVAAAAAKLDDLKNSPRPEEVAVKQTALNQANQTLVNAYAGVYTTLQNAYISADDAVRKQAGIFFIGGDQASPMLSFMTTDSQAQIDSQSYRANISGELTAWNSEISGLGPQSGTADLGKELLKSITYLTDVQTLLKRLSDALLAQSNIPAASLATYQANLTAARTEITASFSNITGTQQTLAADALAVQKAVDDLNLTKAGPTQEALRAQQAAVDAAKANVSDIKAQLEKNTIAAPISGIITRQDAKVGQIVQAQASVVGLISDAQFQIESNVPETDIGNVKLDNPVSLTFDALPGENFTGRVIFIDPAQTVVDGAVNYKIKAVLDKNDPRIKSGFTANLHIQTVSKDNVIVLPQYAIMQNDQGVFVEKLENGTPVRIPVQTGIRSKDGTVEVVSGVSEGEQVLNIGIKTGG